MKWTPENIHPGMWVSKPVTKGTKFVPDGWRAKWMDIVCWDATASGKHGSARYCLTNIGDGMVGQRLTAQGLADRLNANGMVPAPDAWVKKMITWLGAGHRWQKGLK